MRPRGECCNVCAKLEHIVRDGCTIHTYIPYILCTFALSMWGSLKLTPIKGQLCSLPRERSYLISKLVYKLH